MTGVFHIEALFLVNLVNWISHVHYGLTNYPKRTLEWKSIGPKTKLQFLEGDNPTDA